MNQIFPGVHKERGDIFTENLVKGQRAYGEKLIRQREKEFRLWDPTRSKLAAAILNGLKESPINEGSKILYLGASTGTTPSHVSDIVRENGIVYAIEFSERVFRSLLELASKRKNIVPLLADARKPETYSWVEECDIIYCDLAQPEETPIAIRNCKMFLKNGGRLMLAIKSQSIDVTKKPQQVYEEEKKKLEEAGFSILQLIDLEPFQEKHCLIVASR